MRIALVKHSDDPNNCREYFRAVSVMMTNGTHFPQLVGALYCTVDDKIHTCIQETGEPGHPMRDDVEIVEVDAEGKLVKHWQLGKNLRRAFAALLEERFDWLKTNSDPVGTHQEDYLSAQEIEAAAHAEQVEGLRQLYAELIETVEGRIEYAGTKRIVQRN